MENRTVSKVTASFGISLALCSVANAALVVIKERNRAVMAWMQRATGHHWITHGAIVLALFFVLGGGMAAISDARVSKLSAARLLGIILTGTAIGIVVIACFYALNG